MKGPPPGVLEIAAEAVRRLDVGGFIKEQMNPIHRKLEESDAYAESSPVNGDMMFLALSLPITNGVIHIASTREALSEANKWVLEKWEGPHPDPISILSALTLIDIVEEGWKTYKNDPDKREQWKRILRRVGKLSEDMEV